MLKQIIAIAFCLTAFATGCFAASDKTTSQLEEEAHSGNVDSMFDLAEAYRREGLYDSSFHYTGKIDPRYRLWLKKAADAGSWKAQLRLGLELEGEKPPDYTGAFYYYELAAKSGNGYPIECLAKAYLEGKGVAADKNKAIALYEKSGETYPYSNFALGLLYELGTQIPKDLIKARHFYELNCWSNEPDRMGCDRLGNMYLNGEGGPVDLPKAAHVFEKGAERNEPNCQRAIGVMYRDGQGVMQDYVKAYMWLNIIESKSGNTSARDALAAKMTPTQLEEAQMLCRKFKPINPSLE